MIVEICGRTRHKQIFYTLTFSELFQGNKVHSTSLQPFQQIVTLFFTLIYPNALQIVLYVLKTLTGRRKLIKNKDIINSLIKQNESRVKCRKRVLLVYLDATRNPVNILTHFRRRKKQWNDRHAKRDQTQSRKKKQRTGST